MQFTKGQPPRSTSKPYVEAVERYGCQVIAIKMTRSNHVAYVIRHGAHEKVFVAALSPSDRNAHKQFARSVRAWKAGADPHV